MVFSFQDSMTSNHHLFEIRGDIFPLAALVKAVDPGTGKRGPSRPLGGWLTTYGKIGPDGGVVPTVDRDGQVMDAANGLGSIDWSEYLPPKGLWNDTHRDGIIATPRIIVGVPTTLEYHDGGTELSRAHGKVGFWTAGHLFDREDPASWEDFTSYRPTPLDLERADYYWSLANMIFQGLPRKLAFSAHGSATTDPTKKHIVWAKIAQAAVCEVPRNPDATLEVLPPRMSSASAPLEQLAKAIAAEAGMDSLISDLDAVGLPGFDEERAAKLIKRVADYFLFTTDQAAAWVRNRIAALKEKSRA